MIYNRYLGEDCDWYTLVQWHTSKPTTKARATKQEPICNAEEGVCLQE